MPRFFRIGELARLYGVSPDLLRYYEQQNLLCPRRTENGYRMYSIEDIWRLNVIRDLRTLDIPVETIHSYLEDHSAATTRQLLEDELALLNARIRRLETCGAPYSGGWRAVTGHTACRWGNVLSRSSPPAAAMPCINPTAPTPRWTP